MKSDLEERVEQFQTLSLPGQPLGMHMGTAYLVNDLWAAVKELSASQPAVQADAGRCCMCEKWIEEGSNFCVCCGADLRTA